ncbi:MAG: NAD(P)H-hydrate epimerase [Burkholderiales bacterium]|nr:NAD(P)H-hydrate epimerase [Burkholderiales bacterium]
MIVVHHLADSRSQRIPWPLAELGLGYVVRRCEREPKTLRAPPELRALYLHGRSPVIEDHGRTLAESGAIIVCLAGRYDAERPVARAIARRVKHEYVLPTLERNLDFLGQTRAASLGFSGRGVERRRRRDELCGRGRRGARRAQCAPAEALRVSRTHPRAARVPPGARARRALRDRALMAQPVYLTEDIRRIEAAAGDAPLMERAGAAAAALAASLLADRAKDILVLAGPGNNGGDARVAARLLRERFHRVHVAARPAEIPSGVRWGLVVDGLFGIGLSRPLEGEYAALVDYANAQRCPVLALDVPSGIASDTGAVLGRAVRATHTITFIALKPGLLTLDGPDHCGALRVATLDLEPEKLLAPQAWVAEPALFAHALRPRPRNFHKGMAGSVAILGGAAGMTGAALLAGRAALKLGAGRVYVGLLDERAVDPAAPELMLRHPDDALGQALDAVVAGPGLGRSARAEVLVGAVLASELPCVLDADALNLIAENPDLAAACARRSADTLLTPHPAEAARLLRTSTAEVQADRVGAARQLARRFPHTPC